MVTVMTMSKVEAGRLGGLSTLHKYGPQGMSQIGSLGGRPSLEVLELRRKEIKKQRESCLANINDLETLRAEVKAKFLNRGGLPNYIGV